MKEALKRPFEKARSMMDKFQDESKRHDVKATPNKEKMKENKTVQQKKSPEEHKEQSQFGSPLWCAAITQCINKTTEANDDYRCYLCKLFVHPECTKTNKEGRTICIRCAEIGAYDDIMEIEASIIENNGGDTNFINIEGDDPTTNYIETETMNNISALDEKSVNVSGTTSNEEKDEIIQFIIANGITKRSDDRYIQMIANISGVKINFDKIPEKILDQYVANVKTTIGHKDFDTKNLYGNNFKIFVHAMGIKLPRGKHSKKMKETFVKAGLEKLPLLQGYMVKTIPALQAIPKITGSYLPNYSMSNALKEATIEKVIEKIKVMKKEDVKLDKNTMTLMQTLKTITERVLDPKNKFGELTWCARGKDCTNHNIPAPEKLKCMTCKHPVHLLCGKGESFDTVECLNCTEQNSKPAAITRETTSMKTTSNINTSINERQDTQLQFDDFDNDKDLYPNIAATPKRQNIAATPKRHTIHSTISTPKTSHQDRRVTPMQLDENENETEHNGQPKMTTRFDVRFNVRPRDQSADFKDVLKEVVEFVLQLQHSDPTIKVVPWYSKKFDPNSVLALDRLPTSIQELNRYFPRIRIQEGSTWGDMCIVHATEHYDIIALCEVWLDNRGHGMYRKRLQCIATAPIGWMLWSFRAIDTRALSDKLAEMFNIQVDFRFAAITTDRAYKMSTNPIRALHAWIPDDKTFRKTKAILQQTYGSKATTFPLDIKLRMVPMLKPYWDPERIMKIKKLRSRQGSFLKAIATTNCRSGDIMNLEAPTGGLPALRSLIMSERTKDDSGPIFLSVDYAYKRDDLVVFSFLPRNEREARELVTNLAAYMILKYKSNPAIYEYFTPDAYDMIEDAEWDEDNQRLITSDEKYLDDFEFLDDEHMMFDDTDEEPNIITNTPTTRIEKIFLGQTEDSVGTLRTFSTNTTSGLNYIRNPGGSNVPRTPK